MVTDKTKFWSRWGITFVVFGVLSTLGAFVFNKVTAFPEVYPTKVEVAERINTAETYLKESQKALSDSINSNFDKLFDEMKEQRQEIRDIDNYLRRGNRGRTPGDNN